VISISELNDPFVLKIKSLLVLIDESKLDRPIQIEKIDYQDSRAIHKKAGLLINESEDHL